MHSERFTGSSSYLRQLCAVTWKTWLVKSRAAQTLFTEIVAPLCLLFLLLWGFSMSSAQTYEAKHYTKLVMPLSNLGDVLASTINITTPLGPIALDGVIGNVTPALTIADFIELSKMLNVNESNYSESQSKLLNLVNGTCGREDVDCGAPFNKSQAGGSPNCWGGICIAMNTGSVEMMGNIGDILQGEHAGGLPNPTCFASSLILILTLQGPLPVPPLDAFIAISNLAQDPPTLILTAALSAL